MTLTEIARLLPFLALLKQAKLIRLSQPGLPSTSSQPFHGDISILQNRGHFYFALTGARSTLLAQR
ncbi:hypothetical protein QYE77_01880 [Thermanaerothrix sp. 4228-RoL]|uniref:DUF4388 domain-containing protein n=1 Tax=Thermanaerothrix solaris TaxID=3058434 RepID=A0ABU3NJH2_9CHLR|nr:hypothetical protein [Thermanaerothrix sp. 4228-RoL]MDT8896998.1 hypothetical protein [Thermanaerothrix sp. 4228-RoL]